jgi:Sec-independent protein secretion pathway component TatC
MLAIPVILLYEFSIIAARFLNKKARMKKQMINWMSLMLRRKLNA